MLSAEPLGVALSDAPAAAAMEKGLRVKKQVATVDCPKSMVGRVIGKNGETIRALQNYSGALIQIDQTVDPMKVTISGTPDSLNLAVSMVADIVNGTFKGFAMLRQIANQTEAPDALSQPVYAPGYGLIPPSQAQVCTGQFGSGGNPAAGPTGQLSSSPVVGGACGRLRSSPVSPLDMGMAWEHQQQQKGSSAADVIMGLTNSIAQLSVDSSSQTSSLSGSNTDPFLGSSSLTGGFHTSYSHSFDGSPGSTGMGAAGQLGMAGMQSAALKQKLMLRGGFEPQMQANQGMRQTSHSALTGFQHPFSTSSCLSVPAPFMEHEVQRSSPFQSANQVQNLSLMSSSPPLPSDSVYNMASVPASGCGSPIHSTDEGSEQNNCIRLRDPNGRSFFLDVVTGQTRWASNMENAGSNVGSYIFTQ